MLAEQPEWFADESAPSKIAPHAIAPVNRSRPVIAQYLVHVGYAVQLCALLARDVLWLRAMLVVAQSVLAYYAWTRGLLPYVFWNLLFVSINLWWVARLLRERAAVTLPDDVRELHQRHFAALTPAEFLRLWREGARGSMTDARLVREGQRPELLYFILAGEVDVVRGGRQVARLGPGNFVAEMSMLTGEATSADAVARGSVDYIAWPAAKLERLQQDNPALWSRLQSVLGHDLVEKLKRTVAAATA